MLELSFGLFHPIEAILVWMDFLNQKAVKKSLLHKVGFGLNNLM
jgi:hypothetical protein